MNEMITTQGVELMAAISPDMIQKYINFIDASDKTIDTYTRSMRRFVKYLADNGISKPTRADILLYRDMLKREELKPATVQAYIIAVRQFFRWTETEGIYPNVARNIKGAKIERAFKKDALTSRQARGMLKDIDTSTHKGARDYAILALMITGGLRTIEVSRADIGDMRPIGDETVLFVQGKGKTEKSDFIKLSEKTEKAIRQYLSFRGKASDKEPLFASASNKNKGQRMTTRSISRIVKGRLTASGLESDRLSAHSLRHTAATLNLLNGGSLEETQQLLRHSKIDTTMIYSHHLKRIQSQAENRIAKAIF